MCASSCRHVGKQAQPYLLYNNFNSIVIFNHHLELMLLFRLRSEFQHRQEYMIKCLLARLMGERKLRVADVIRETGLSRNIVTFLYKETAQKVGL
ncbi:helix-turn-helix domain-containing protein [Rosenbergiella nectarea]|uniref:helix-turn-helix domain-containing protein n=1 Tax=Rosenbergiella nectarea TaxID=988801 RepID=UPI003F6CC02E